MKILSFFLFSRLALGACIAVSGDQILTGDLARALPQFASLAADVPIGFSPAPGVDRVVSGGEIRRLAARFGISGEASGDICFRVETEVLSAERLETAVRAALSDDQVSIAVLDFSRYPIPRGELQFLRSRLNGPASGSPGLPVIWRGVVRTASGRTSPVWVRLRLLAPIKQIIAASAISAGQMITDNLVRIETVQAFPFRRQSEVKREDIVNHVARVPFSPGQTISVQSVSAKPAIQRGDFVRITVTSASARVSFEAPAESSASVGQTFRVRNPGNKQELQAVAEGPGKGRVEVRR